MKLLSTVMIIGTILIVAPATTSAQDGTRVGLGVGVTSAFTPDNLESEFGAFMSTINIPITGQKIRIEPMVGFVRTSNSSENIDVSISGLRLGSGIFGLKRTGNTIFYFGGRAGIMRNSVSFDVDDAPQFGPEDESSTDFFLAPATGVEYLFEDTFSLGGEVQLVYTRFGNESEDSDDSMSAMHTKTVFFVRWHF